METRIISINQERIQENLLKGAGDVLRAGGLVAFPTETVYGLGGDALNPHSSEKIYAAKGRPSDNPLIVHISRFEDMQSIVSKVTPEAVKIAKAFWPGPLTMILPKSERVPYETTGGLETISSSASSVSFITSSTGSIFSSSSAMKLYSIATSAASS